MSESSITDNPTRALLAEAVASGCPDTPLDFNPALASLGTTLVEAREGQLVLRFTVPQTATQGNGVVGGGSLASMLDLAMAMAVLSKLQPGYTCSTISLTVNMQTAGTDDQFIAVAGVDRVGRQISFAHAKLFNLDRSRLVASATSSLAVLPVRA